jgi:hypothetical protein
MYSFIVTPHQIYFIGGVVSGVSFGLLGGHGHDGSHGGLPAVSR